MFSQEFIIRAEKKTKLVYRRLVAKWRIVQAPCPYDIVVLIYDKSLSFLISRASKR